jgi:hypothetical protein
MLRPGELRPAQRQRSPIPSQAPTSFLVDPSQTSLAPPNPLSSSVRHDQSHKTGDQQQPEWDKRWQRHQPAGHQRSQRQQKEQQPEIGKPIRTPRQAVRLGSKPPLSFDVLPGR